MGDRDDDSPTLARMAGLGLVGLAALIVLGGLLFAGVAMARQDEALDGFALVPILCGLAIGADGWRLARCLAGDIETVVAWSLLLAFLHALAALMTPNALMAGIIGGFALPFGAVIVLAVAGRPGYLKWRAANQKGTP